MTWKKQLETTQSVLRFMIFNALYAGACGYALLRGAAPERFAALAMVAAIQLTPVVISPLALRYQNLELGVFMVDAALFAALYVLGCVSTRYWTLWMTGLQAAVICSHFAGQAPRVIAWTASWATSAWSYPMLALLAVATWRHQRRLGTYGYDPSWAWQLSLSHFSKAAAHDSLARPAARRST